MFPKKLSYSALFLMLFIGLSSFSAVKNHVGTPHKAAFYEASGDLPDWALLDPDKDGYEGTRTLALYEYLASQENKRERKQVIVAIIDSGFDINHPDLKDNVWNNLPEVNGTAGVDDDNNGYIDDFHGWNFLGDVKYLPLELTREYYRLKKEGVSENDPYFKKVKEEFENEKNDVEENVKFAEPLLRRWEDAERILAKRGYSTDPAKLKALEESLTGEYSDAANLILSLTALGIGKEDLEELAASGVVEKEMLTEQGSRKAMEEIGDDPNNLTQKGYGSNKLLVADESHGTHVAGIIAGKKEGIGQAPFATLMLLRAVPNEGDERDKDIGNAIRYAVDNGAQIINMSAGKYFSVNPDYVIEAVRYAEEKGVLFVNSAGNEAANIEETINYPAKFFRENGEIKYFSNMIVVGASSWMKKSTSSKDPDGLNGGYDLAASFSNYSDKIVDLFAPGVEINSTVPGAKYKRISGTSMASPEVTGIAAVLKAYFPSMTASQIKEVLNSSVRKYEGLNVKVPGESGRLPFSELSKSGGVIDMMNAFKMAEQLYSN